MLTESKNALSHYIAGRWVSGEGGAFTSTNPATGDAVWEGRHATLHEVDAAVATARQSFETWGSSSLADRISCVERFAEVLSVRRSQLAETISLEVGKPHWESLTEVDAMIGKVALSIRAYAERRAAVVRVAGEVNETIRYKPHGVVGVLGPFNFPGHLPNGHIVPALLAGNTVVFKPSELTPLVAAQTVEAWQAAGLPPGVLNLVQGGRETGAALVAHPDLDGLLFTGSAAVGQAIHRAFAATPQKILALEMGGNNPLVIWHPANVAAAVYITLQSAYLTSGQRCASARRLIVPQGAAGDRFIEKLVAAIGKIRVGVSTDHPEPFMGPVISAAASERLLHAQDDLISRGGEAIVPMRRIERGPAMLSPGLMDVTHVPNRDDTEHFGPFLQLIRVVDFEDAIEECNHTAFGLCAALVCDDRSSFERFFRRVRAGVINFNRPSTGASSALPFGGVGLSGNHRPSAYFAADYCSDPVASVESDLAFLPALRLPGIEIE